MAKRTIGYLAIIFAVLFFSCGKKDCLSSSGEQKSEIRSLETFRKIDIYNYFNVYLKSDTVNKVEIEAGEKLISNIETSIVDSVLTIRDLNACGFMKGYDKKNLYISVDTLSEVIINDGINLYSSDTLKFPSLNVLFLSDIGYCDLTFDCNNVNFQVWYGSGDYILRGKTNSMYFAIHTLAFGYAEELETKSCYAFNGSMGNCYVNVSGQLRALIKDEGNIYYKGNPTEVIVEEHSGTGKLIENN